MRTVNGMRRPDRARSVTEAPAAAIVTRLGSARSSRESVSSASSGGGATVGARREADALVLRVGHEVNDALSAGVEVDLQRVAGGVAEEARLIARVGGRIVEPALGEGEHGPSGRERCRELREQQEGGE